MVLHHPDRCGHADLRVPRLRRRGPGARVPQQPARGILDAVHRGHGGDLPARVLPRLHRDRGRRHPHRRPHPAGGSEREHHRGVVRSDGGPEHPDLVPHPRRSDSRCSTCGAWPPAVVKTLEIYRGRGAVFIVLQLIGLAIAGTFPSLVNYLPNRVYLSSDTAPPPMNPKLQHCLDGLRLRPVRRERRRASCPHRSGRGHGCRLPAGSDAPRST